MERNIDFFKINHKPFLPKEGRVLISQPGLMDQYFKRSIIIIVEHNQKGTIGFVLNNIVDLNLKDFLPDFPDFAATISVGGPVESNSIHFIHTLGDIIPNTIKISDGLYWGGDFDVVKVLIEQKKLTARQIRFFMGYAGWGESQLSDELKEHSWVVSELDLVQIMAGKEDLWNRTVRQMGPKYKPWTIYPENPSLN
ncbi:MAG: YqgE/AlgH family protein [Bacteroidales bacterium]|nr:YqgE/AlgH family protein [Bacteroidales bacterium]MDD3893306.1 YqgE/AlgH family protein [Bacteroidales bacterium]